MKDADFPNLHQGIRKGGSYLRGNKNAAALKPATPAKLRKKWRFAPDAIGMIDGPKDLSRRKVR